jgi:hypothetical protein
MSSNINSGLTTLSSRIALGLNRNGMEVNEQWLRKIYCLLIAVRRSNIYQSRSHRLRLAPCTDLDYGEQGASYFLIYDYDATFCISSLDSINIGRFNK